MINIKKIKNLFYWSTSPEDLSGMFDDVYIPRLDKQIKYDRYYMDLAIRASKMSHCNRKKVGSIAIKGNQIISDAWNGTPSGMDNCCEDENGDTKPHVLHSESNLISKISKSNETSEGCTVYCTLSCCIECAKILHQAGVKRFVYLDDYKDMSGIELLKELNIEVVKL